MPNPLHFKKIITLTLVGTILGVGLYHEMLNEKIIESAAAQTIENNSNQYETKTLTYEDFNGYGRENKFLREIPTMRVSIHPKLAPFTFKIISFTENSRGSIAVYHNDELIQIINLQNPNMYVAGAIHTFFNVADINFDGYADIGVLEEGGAKWGAYQYWTYDKTTNQFITSDFTKDFRALNFNQIKFDLATKQISTNNFCGPLICDKDIYEARDNRLILIETHHQEQPYNENGIEEKCIISITKYQDRKEKTTTESIDEFCPGYYWKI